MARWSGRIMHTPAAPEARPWRWSLAYGHHRDRTPTFGYEATREAAMADSQKVGGGKVKLGGRRQKPRGAHGSSNLTTRSEPRRRKDEWLRTHSLGSVEPCVQRGRLRARNLRPTRSPAAIASASVPNNADREPSRRVLVASFSVWSLPAMTLA